MPDEGQASATGDASQGTTQGTGDQGTSSTPAASSQGAPPGASAQETTAAPADSGKESTPDASAQAKGSTAVDSGKVITLGISGQGAASTTGKSDKGSTLSTSSQGASSTTGDSGKGGPPGTNGQGTGSTAGDSSKGISGDEESKLAKKLRRTWICLIVLFAIGILVLLLQWGIGCISGAALIWALACLALGYIWGFLFAVPRVPRTSEASDQGQPASGQKAVNSASGPGGLGINTNLTEISDWLTKIIVGLGLVQLRNLPSYIRRMGDYVGMSLQSSSTKAAQNQAVSSMASGLVLYFTGLGFVSGYLLTRMFLSPAFRLADLATTTGVDSVAREKADTASQTASSAAETAKTAAESATAAIQNAAAAMELATQEAKVNSAISTAMEELNRNPLQQASIDRLIGQLGGYRSRFPVNRRLAIVLGRLYAEGKSQYDDAINVLQSFVDDKAQANQASDVNVADAFFNIGCYYSKKMEQDKDPDKVRADGENCLKAIDQSLKLAPQNAKDVATDPDFTAVRNSSEFGPRVQQLLKAAGPGPQQS